ncbi:MAG: divalent-cation tolerance protein CutA [Chloroflexia bacterium]
MSPSDNIVMLYVPCGSEEESARIITVLLEERLGACGNILPSQSFYRSEGKVINETELVLVCKTTQGRAHQAKERIAQLHSYETPCIIAINTASVNPAYAQWVLNQVGGGAEMPKHDASNTRSEVNY